MPDHHSAPYVRGSDTSEGAAESIAPRLSELQGVVLAALRCYPQGATDEQVQEWIGMAPSTQRPRRIELVAKGLVEDSGMRRRTKSGRAAVVWRSKP